MNREEMMSLPRFSLCFHFLFFISLPITVIESRCKKGCDLALASYYTWENTNITFISEVLNSQLVPKGVADPILEINKEVADEDRLEVFIRVNVPFPCDCIDGEFLGHVFEYEVKSGDTLEEIASLYYSNLTTVEWLRRSNIYEGNEMPDNVKLNVTVNCSCGDTSVSKDYGLFITYQLRPGETLDAVLTQTNLSKDVAGLVQSYNEGVNFSRGHGLVFVPGKGD